MRRADGNVVRIPAARFRRQGRDVSGKVKIGVLTDLSGPYEDGGCPALGRR
jgi:hypothetical protein